MKYFILTLQLFLTFSLIGFSQDPLRFEKEIEGLKIKYPNPIDFKGAILFTGSSSIKLWKTLERDFPSHTVVNTGFGGSQTNDLLFYLDKLVIPFQPKKIFIYEGDNDISSKKPTKTILKTIENLVLEIKRNLPESEIFLISAKPSISRWNLKDKYTEFNIAMARYAKKTNNVTFVDVWQVMLNEKGLPKEDIFLEDNLHMNGEGYKLWVEVIQKYM